jgi:hypothetical protein
VKFSSVPEKVAGIFYRFRKQELLYIAGNRIVVILPYLLSPFGACQPQAGGIKGEDFISASENKSYYVLL